MESLDSPAPPGRWSRKARLDADMRISILLRNLKYEMFQRMRHVLRYERLTEQQWRVLRAVETFTFVNHASLCRATGLTRSSVTRVVRALLDRNLIIREWPKNAQGRPTPRHYKVMLTNHGRRVFDRVRKDADVRYLDAEGKFAEDDLNELYRLMDRFIVALRGAEFEATDEPHRSLPHRDDHNGRWITNETAAKRRAYRRTLFDGIPINTDADKRG